MTGIYRDLDVSIIRENLYNNIEKSLEGRTISSSDKESINKFMDYICDEYIKTLSHSSLEIEISKVITNTNRTIDKVKNILLIAISIDFILLFVLNLKSIYMFITNLGVSLMICGLFLISAVVFINMRLKIHTIVILNDIISDVLRNTLSTNLHVILKYGLVLTILSIGMIFVSNLIHNSNKTKNKKEENKKTKENVKLRGER